MSKSVAIGAAITLAASVTLLTGCANVRWSVKGSCNTKRECQVSGEISGGGVQKQLMAALFMASETVPDAAQFNIDISGSTVSYPGTGTVTIKLVDSSTGTLQAAGLFNWVRQGNVLKLANPDAVNDWAAAYGGTADTMSYSLTRFNSSYGAGTQTMATAAVYEGSVVAASSISFESCVKPGTNTPYPCPQ